MPRHSRLIVVLLGLALDGARAQEVRYGLPVSTPAAEGIDTAAMRVLLDRVKETHSSAIVVLKDGKLVAEWYGHRRAPIEAMSATKSIVSMLLGQLIDAGKLQLDQPVYTLFPEWTAGRRAKITVRHLMNHTSGLQADVTTEKIYASRDFVKHALTSEIIHEPGSVFFYNNSALNLLAGVGGKAAGVPIDRFANTSLFKPLGITDWSWTKDDAGNPHGMSGLQIHAVDLAKLGQVMLNGGVWQGTRLLSSEWIRTSTAPGQPYNPTNALLWWLFSDMLRYYVDQPLLDSWRAAGISDEYVRLFSDMTNTGPLKRAEWRAAITKRIPDEKREWEFRNALARAGVMAQRYDAGTMTEFYASGYLGQYLVVVPSEKIVAVRQIRSDRFKGPDDNLADFTSLVWRLRPPPTTTP